MNIRASKFGDRSRTTRCLIWTCVLLVAMSAAVQALHLHIEGPQNELKNCPVCHMARGTAVAILVLALFFVHHAATFIPLAEDIEVKTIFCSFTLFSRPPPLAWTFFSLN